MPWSLLHHTDFSLQPNAGPVDAGLVLSDGWKDVAGNVWTVASGKLKTTVNNPTAFQLCYLRRNDEVVSQDQRIIIRYPANNGTLAAQIGCFLRDRAAPGRSYYSFAFGQTQAFVRTSLNDGAGGGLPGLIDLAQAVDQSHAYELDCSVEGINPTTLKLKLTDLTTSTVLCDFTGEDSTSELQNGTGFKTVVLISNDGSDAFVSDLYAYWVDPNTLTAAPLSVAAQSATQTTLAQGGATGGTGPYSFVLYGSLIEGFTPGPEFLIADGVTFPYVIPATPSLEYFKVIVTDAVDDTAETSQLEVATYQPALKIGFIGDSITAHNVGGFTPPSATAAFLAKFRQRRSVTIENAALEATSTVDWLPGTGNLDNTKAAWVTAGVEIVCIMLGTNDARLAIALPAAEYKANMLAIAESLAEAGFKVVLNAPLFIVPEPAPATSADESTNALLLAYATALAEIADNQHIFLGDTLAYEWFGNNQAQLSDGLHPGAAGVLSLGEMWAVALDRILGATESGDADLSILLNMSQEIPALRRVRALDQLAMLDMPPLAVGTTMRGALRLCDNLGQITTQSGNAAVTPRISLGYYSDAGYQSLVEVTVFPAILEDPAGWSFSLPLDSEALTTYLGDSGDAKEAIFEISLQVGTAPALAYRRAITLLPAGGIA